MAVSTIALVMMKFHNNQVSDNQHIVKYSPLGHYFLHSICAYVDLVQFSYLEESNPSIFSSSERILLPEF